MLTIQCSCFARVEPLRTQIDVHLIHGILGTLTIMKMKFRIAVNEDIASVVDKLVGERYDLGAFCSDIIKYPAWVSAVSLVLLIPACETIDPAFYLA